MQTTSEILPLFTEETLQELTLSHSDRLAKISQWLDGVPVSQAQKVALSSTQLPSLLASDQVYLSGRTLKEHSPQTLAQTFGRLSKRLPTLGIIQSNGNCLIQAGYSPRWRKLAACAPEWGAVPNKKYFVLYLGKIINTKNIDK